MLSGGAVVAIWNGIAPAWRDEFYAWHNGEHMPERLAIPGFRCGRRFIADGPDTFPEWFTLYETENLAVLSGSAYVARLNQPTPWTRVVTQNFRDTSRVIARVALSVGPGMGGAMLTLRFNAPAGTAGALARLVEHAATSARVTGAHLCVSDTAASGVVTVESAGRTDLLSPPGAALLVEGCDVTALVGLLPDAALRGYGLEGPIDRGVYCLEHCVLWAAK